VIEGRGSAFVEQQADRHTSRLRGAEHRGDLGDASGTDIAASSEPGPQLGGRQLGGDLACERGSFGSSALWIAMSEDRLRVERRQRLSRVGRFRVAARGWSRRAPGYACFCCWPSAATLRQSADRLGHLLVEPRRTSGDELCDEVVDQVEPGRTGSGVVSSSSSSSASSSGRGVRRQARTIGSAEQRCGGFDHLRKTIDDRARSPRSSASPR
jgi:hypothetical protein